MYDPVKICVVGCGRVAKSHLAGMLEIPGKVKIEAVVSRDQKKGEEFQRAYAAHKVYNTLEQALADPKIEAVDLCLPNHLHKDTTIRSVKAGKHVLVEKPMANTVAECGAMNKAAEEARVILMVGQSRRFYDAVFKSKELVDSKEIGDLVGITANLFAYIASPPTDWWRDREKAGGLAIPIWGSHIIDYVLWMYGGMLPERVYCEAYSNNPVWDGEDEVSLLLGYGQGKFSSIRISWNTKLEEMQWDGEGKMLSSSDIRYERFITGTNHTLHLDDETKLTLDGRIINVKQDALA